jgi:O-methyltransferase
MVLRDVIPGGNSYSRRPVSPWQSAKAAMALTTNALRRYAEIRDFVPRPVRRLLNLVWCLAGYGRILSAQLPLRTRWRLIRSFLRVDSNVARAHQPAEMAEIVRWLASRKPGGELFVEAGCWKGSSSCKFSHLCEILGYKLMIYDSFAGVEAVDESSEMDFSRMYASTREEVAENLRRYGVAARCELIPGWFSESIAHGAPATVAAAYIDCDLAKGTYEVLSGIIGKLSPDGVVFTQDYHIPVVRNLLHDPNTWRSLGVGQPVIQPLCFNLAALTLAPPQSAMKPTTS